VNVHHLELFYHVARHRGISNAVRHMPYGIQQPAMSSQIGQLERDLGVRLFERSPFRLTRAGEELFDFVRPFFGNLDGIAARLGKHAAPLLRLGAAELMLRDHLPALVREIRRSQPALQLALRSGFTPELLAALREREIDLAIVPQSGRTPGGRHSVPLLRLPLVLLVPSRAPLRSAAALWQRARIDTPLISLPEREVITQVFKRGLKRLWVDWPCAIEASSLDLITRYVANGQGFGLSVHLGAAPPRQVRALPLEGFEPIDIVALWAGKPSPLIEATVAAARRYAAEKLPGFAPA
jgi:DNA-binding transcriptional LysR family regulator